MQMRQLAHRWHVIARPKHSFTDQMRQVFNQSFVQFHGSCSGGLLLFRREPCQFSLPFSPGMVSPGGPDNRCERHEALSRAYLIRLQILSTQPTW